MGQYIEILTADGERHYAYNPDETVIESLVIADVIADLGIDDDNVAVVAIADNPEVLANG